MNLYHLKKIALNNTVNCPTCGGEILGDGYTVVLHCEYAEEIDEYTPDDGVVLCPIQVER